MARNNPKPELLVGVGSFPCAVAAVKNGADAVFFGVRGYNMRDLGKNFSSRELKKLMAYLHENNVNGYLALNTIIFESEIAKVKKILSSAKKAAVDAVIVSDLGVISLAGKEGLRIHISTQASVANSVALGAYKKLGAKRIVLARELPLRHIKKLAEHAKKLGIGIECFAHGSMCIAVSGRCFLSHEVFGTSANRGRCLQVCRRAYFLDGDFPDLEKKEIYLDGKTILSAKDLKTISFLDKLILAGASSLKIEGRTKQATYVAAATKCYREAIDSVHDGSFSGKLVHAWGSELSKVYNRGFSEGFYFSEPDSGDISRKEHLLQSEKRVPVGKVVNFFTRKKVAEIKLDAPINTGDIIVIEGKTTFLKQKLNEMQLGCEPVTSAGKDSLVTIKTGERARKNDLVFVLKNNS